MYALDILKCFTMNDCMLCSTPFQLSVKLTKECLSPKFDATLYQQFFDSLIYLTRS